MKDYILPKGTEPIAEIIKALIDSSKRKCNIGRFNKLEDYFMNKETVSREAPHRLLTIVNHARYIVKVNIGYLLGSPVEYMVTKDYNIQPVIDEYRRQTIGDLDMSLAKDCSIFGRAYERVYSNEDARAESAIVDPRHIIMVYDDTVKHNKMFAVIYTPAIDNSGKEIADSYKLTILTGDKIMQRTLDGKGLTGSEDEPHVFGEVPVVEYLNDDDMVGDFEPVITLIDAYNILQSDRVLDREMLLDAILAFYGIDFTPEQKKDLQEGRMLSGIPQDAKIEYIIKNINEADADVLRKTLAGDIHKISMTPDMSDENFAGNSSGVAIQYKLLAFENNAKSKERHFERGLMERFRLYNNFLATKSKMKNVPNEEVDVTFKRSLPQNDLETSQIINNLHGIVDDELLVGQLSFVRDSKETVAQAAAEEVDKKTDDKMSGNEITDQNKTNSSQDES